MNKMRNITCFEFGRTLAWWVRVERRTKELWVRKWFYYNDYGGKALALVEAMKFRDEAEKRVPKAERKKGRFGPGKIRFSYVTRRTEKRHPVWQGWIRRADGRIASTSFSVKVHGRRGAKDLICKWHKAKTLERNREMKKMAA